MSDFPPLDRSKISKEALEKLRVSAPKLWQELEDQKHVNVWLKKFITTYDSINTSIKDVARKLSEVDDPVLIQGETGTGKELIANALHGERTGKFMAINCAGIPETLIESTLFGHIPGAFTGASKEARVGVLQAAHNGTIFLDEIGELEMSVQAKLLRALQEKVITRVGAEDKDAIEINCRIVCATHQNLKSRIKTGQFREDLYYRISTFELNIPPLRERSGDIAAIVKALIIKERARDIYEIEDIDEFVRPILNHISNGGTSALSGNVRQLEQYVRRYHVLGVVPKL